MGACSWGQLRRCAGRMFGFLFILQLTEPFHFCCPPERISLSVSDTSGLCAGWRWKSENTRDVKCTLVLLLNLFVFIFQVSHLEKKEGISVAEDMD